MAGSKRDFAGGHEMIIGVSGPIGAGKTTFCKILQKKGFKYASLSDVLREECKRRKLPVSRENLRKIGDELRAKYGKKALAFLVWKKIDKGNWVIDSIRVPEEANYLRSKGAFIVGIFAPQKLRYERSIKRERDKFTSFEEFKEVDEKDRSLGIDDVLKEADFVIINDGSKEELKKSVEKLISFISSPS